MPTLRELAQTEEVLVGGHRACVGCLSTVALRQVMASAGKEVVVGSATGCMEVVTTIYPYTAWRVPFIHDAFENVAATISGVEAAYQALRRKGKIDQEIKFIAIGGDGGTYDIGLQSLSGAMERGHDMLYVCYNNEAYMNTGVQRSSATPFASWTSTSPVGTVEVGKKNFPKDLTEIMAAHNIPYVAQAAVHHWKDLATKVQKALSIRGPKFINIIAPCTLGWKFPPEIGLDISRLAVDTCIWPLYEVENGKRKLTHRPKEKKPIIEYLKLQDRFKHLLKAENQPIVDQIQKEIDERWNRLTAN
jgi:pyruvate ferredoxin oxidoreductase beta subunit